MKVNVAGAGAGKTTMMSELITGLKIPEGKIVFCIAFTNAAANNIAKKVEREFDRNIVVKAYLNAIESLA